MPPPGCERLLIEPELRGISRIMPELPRLIVILDNGEEVICEKNQVEHRQDVYIRKKIGEISLSMRPSPYGLATYYSAHIVSNPETKTFNDHNKAVDWILEMLDLEAY